MAAVFPFAPDRRRPRLECVPVFPVSESPPAGPPSAEDLPRALLYSTSAGFGGTGLHLTSLQSALAAHEAGILKKAIGYSIEPSVIPRAKIRSLAWHPVRLLGGLGSRRYYGAKKRYVDWIASRELARGQSDCFHSWSGDCLRSLLVARQQGIPTLLEIPTWHRNKGRVKSFETRSERELRNRRGLRAWLDRLPPSRQRILVEYALADLVLVQSTFAAETFLAAGMPAEKIVYVARGADIERFTPAESPPPIFRAIFAGALIKRKGVHHLLEAWHSLTLKNAELELVGTVHPEIEPSLREFAGPSVKVLGFSNDLPARFRSASVFIFPSECEGWAKVTFEAAAAGLPMIATRESGDGVIDGVTGFLVPANDPGALAEKIRHAYDHAGELPVLGRAARRRVVENFTWKHFRLRLLHAYARARQIGGGRR
jgi:glycosyltransferase involved in cell wall biosynthesis